MLPTTFPRTQWPPLATGQHRYLLLDGAQCDAPQAVLQFLPHAASRLFDGLLADGSADTSVYLSRLPPELPAEAVLLRLDGHAKALGAATVIESALTQDVLLQRLSRRLDARYPNGKEFLARFYDGRVLPWWVQALDREQREVLLAVGERWHYVTHDHRWDTLVLTCPDIDPHLLPWTLEAEQRRVLIDSALPADRSGAARSPAVGQLVRVPARRGGAGRPVRHRRQPTGADGVHLGVAGWR